MAIVRPTIRVLSDELANQIAAGEVVERPASVVKELVENAIDAGARRIQVAVRDGGKRLIRVVDDGCGLTAVDVDLALQRHATSKLKSVDDLMRIGTLGFRGEALPSIASVSRMTVISRPEEAVAGVQCDAAPGGPPKVREIGCPVGTTVEVADLFYNVPARLKFLKTDRTESSHVAETLLHLALAWPGIHFTLTEDERRSLDLPRHADLTERASAALGRRGRGRLHPARITRDGMVIEAALGSPIGAVATARNVYLLVNRRGVRDRMLLRMLAQGYGELLDRGRYPVAVLQVQLPPEQVDVNVHPQKLEVRFTGEKEIAKAIHLAVSDGVRRAPWASAAGVGRVIAGAGGGEEGREEGEGGTVPRRPFGGPERIYHLRPAQAPRSSYQPRFGESADGASGAGFQGVSPTGEPIPAWQPTSVGDQPVGDGAAGGRASSGVVDPQAPPDTLLGSRYLGQIMETYLVFEGDGALVLVDQHAAHERVTYGRLRDGLAAGGIQMQRLLFPAQITLGPEEEQVVREQAELLGTCGFDVALLSGRTGAVRGVPALLADCDAGVLFREVAGELSGAPLSETLERRLDNVAATLACHGSVRGGQVLDLMEVRALLRAMEEVERSGHCPHGRPVAIRLEESEIRRRFGRQ